MWEAYHHQHCDQVIGCSVFLQDAVQCLHVPGARLGVSPRNITCVGMLGEGKNKHEMSNATLSRQSNQHGVHECSGPGKVE